MRLSHRVCTGLGIRQIAIDNYYDDYVEAHLLAEWPNIDRWLLLGLISGGVPVRTTGRDRRYDAAVRAISRRARPPPARPRGGDGLRSANPADRRGAGGAAAARSQSRRAGDAGGQLKLLAGEGLGERPGLRILPLPSDEQLYDSLSQAKVVFGKAGFQQVVESIGMGAPIICQLCGGGIDQGNLAPFLHPLVRFVSGVEDLPRVLFEVAGWLLQPPSPDWSALADRVQDPLEARRSPPGGAWLRNERVPEAPEPNRA